MNQFLFKEDEEEKKKNSISSYFNCAKIVTEKKNIVNSSPEKMQFKKRDSGKSTAKLCQNRVSKCFIIPASKTVCQIFWTRRLKTDVLTFREYWELSRHSGVSVISIIFEICIPMLLHSQVIFIVSQVSDRVED